MDTVKRILRALISKEWAIPGLGWQEDEMKARFRALAKLGWDDLKTFVELMRVEVVLRMTNKVARVEVGRELRPRKGIMDAVLALSRVATL
ncbi:hypothetical protein SUGI_0708210 [Cryptomeria japonica]|nr:hypothetical protein SUGI_0708210 [Cryptomeria japonica]